MTALETCEYGELSMEMRMTAIVALMHLALDGPSVRTCLDGRLEEAQRVRKSMWDEAKACHRLIILILISCTTFSLPCCLNHCYCQAMPLAHPSTSCSSTT